jgi:hypothetical protein
MKYIELTQGKRTMVDDEDYNELSKYKWYARKTGKKYYVLRHFYAGKKQYKHILLHRMIMNTPDGMCTDHINGDGLDNRKSNLRICTISENLMNRGSQKNNASGLKGAYYNKRAKNWQSYIKAENKNIYLGSFRSKEQAHDAYCEASKKYHGEFANTG